MMKRLHLLKSLLLLCALIAGSGMAWAADETITFSDLNLTNGVQYSSFDGNNYGKTFSLSFGSGSNDGKYYTTGEAIRVYGGGNMTVTSSKTIVKIELTFGSGDGSNTITTNNGSYSNGTWTGSSTSVKFTVGGTSGHRRIAAVAVTYGKSDPNLSIQDVAMYADDMMEVGDLNVTTSSAGAITYTSEDPTVADIEDGVLYAYKVGSTTITANQAENGNYTAASTTFTVTVTAAPAKPADPVFSITDGTAVYYGTKVKVTASNSTKVVYTTDGSNPTASSATVPVTGIPVTTNITIKALAFKGDTQSDNVVTASYTLKAPEAPTFSVASGDVTAGTTVELAAGEGGSVVVYTTDGNDPTTESEIYVSPITISAAVTIKAATVDDGNNLSSITSASYTIYVPNEFTKVTDAATLRAGDQLLIVYEEGEIAMGALNSTYHDGVSASISGEIITDPSNVAILTLGGEEGAWTLQSSLTGNYLKLGNYENTLTENQSITVNEKWKISIDNDGNAQIVNYYYGTKSASDKTVRYIQWNKSSPRFACYTGTQKNVQLYRLSQRVTITEAEYATYNGPKALNFDGIGIKAYTATDNETSVTLNNISSGKVPANTPVVLYYAGGTTACVPVIASADAVGDNDLRISNGEDVEHMYVLAMNPTIGFYPWGGTNLSAGKVFLQGKASYGAREFLFFDVDHTTGISTTTPNNSVKNNEVYNLAGLQVIQPRKGLYIVNGHKVAIK